ncbi:hypothetical protein CK203_025629 [Vitis vinifera]|uniref:Reverse transcriptase zinc-binding domain-containing protein n=1 Tax=Vitis vinifera TaxID=29760 RepID=A0A438IEM4_VITVI|nr:hypothetical protein CK203_025629 [Vitis vinifera]
MPRKVRLRLEKIQRYFLLGGGALVQKPHLVRWNIVCLEKRKCGLSVRNLALMNIVLLSKWNWRFANEREYFWKPVINHKYGEEERERGGWCRSRAMSERYGVGLWKAIRNEWIYLGGRLAYQVVKSLYSILEPGDSSLFPNGSIWRASVLHKVAFFAWEASWGKVLTLEQLQRKGHSVASRYFLCLSEAKTVDRFLLHCAKTRVLWNLLFSFFGVVWILSCSVKETLLGWHGAFVGKTHKKA